MFHLCGPFYCAFSLNQVYELEMGIRLAEVEGQDSHSIKQTRLERKVDFLKLRADILTQLSVGTFRENQSF